MFFGLTCDFVEAGFVEEPWEEFESDDGVDDDDEEDEEGDVEQRDHGHQDGVQHHLQTWGTKEKATALLVFLTIGNLKHSSRGHWWVNKLAFPPFF